MKKINLASLFLVISLCVTIACVSSCTNSSTGSSCGSGCSSCSADKQPSASTVVLLDAQTTSWDGAELIDYPTTKPAITMLKITVAPKSRLPLHYHPVINVGYMLEGSLTVTDDKGNSKTIKAGEPLIETVNTIHYGENRGDTDAVILVFYAGTEGVTITEKSECYPKK